jgi:aryl-alcohol dehydrogenase-like predicted oxidoreductase
MQDWGCDQAAANEIVKQFIEAGGNFIDTADVYSHGVAEEMLGRAVADHGRDELVLATKCWFRMHPSANAKGLSRKHILEAVEASLRRLKTDYIDLFQLHGPDPFTPIEETMRTMDDLVRSGKVRYVGCSNFYGWQIVRANALAERLGLNGLVSGQHMYSLLRRDVEREILPACDDQGMGMLCWSPLAGGMLTGKYQREQGPPPDSRVGLRAEIDMPRYWNDDSFRIIDETLAIAKSTGQSPAAVALAWLLHDCRVAAVIVGARSAQQLGASLEAADWDLPDDLHQRLSSVVPFAQGYPADWIELTFGNLLPKS